MKDLNVIIPVHVFDKDVKKMLLRAIESVDSELPIRVSCAEAVKDEVSKTVKELPNIEVVSCEKSDFCSLVNNGVGDSKWFSILEFDDVYTDIWLDNFRKYADYLTDASVFMFLEDLVNDKDGKFVGFGNEAIWAASFSNEIGFIDNDCLKEFFDFYLTGSIFNTEDWKKYGGLKPSIKLAFWYEYLLRMTYNGKKVFVIPKVGYKHTLGRKDSLLEQMKDTVDDKEAKWWLSLAKREQFYKEDRNKTYDASKASDEDEEEK